MLTILRTNQFKKDYKTAKKRGCDLSKLIEIITILVNEKPLPQKHRDHALAGEYNDCRECHIEPDWLLMYQLREDALILIRTGTHADLFE
jgi:mRNA interferase YafQ